MDNGSDDGSAAAIAVRHPQVKLFALSENRGFTGGINTALRGSAATHVVFLNNDAVPQPGWLGAISRAMESAPPDVVSLAGKITDLTGKYIDFVGGVMTFDGHAFQDGFRYPIGAAKEPAPGAELLFACGGNMISRRNELTALGGFDDDYFAYLEDVDFGWRTWIAGFRVLYEPRAVVRHASGATSERLGNFERGVLFERNALQTVIKNYEEDVLRDIAGSVFYAYLRRLHHYATTRNRRAEELTRPAFRGTSATNQPPSFLSRVRRRLLGAAPLVAVDDPLTTMQFRAFQWVVENETGLVAKRKAVQSMRRRSDQEIFSRFPAHLVPTYPGDERMLAGPLFRLLWPDLPSVERELGDIIRT